MAQPPNDPLTWAEAKARLDQSGIAHSLFARSAHKSACKLRAGSGPKQKSLASSSWLSQLSSFGGTAGTSRRSCFACATRVSLGTPSLLLSAASRSELVAL
jgi:hypothetical protein